MKRQTLALVGLALLVSGCVPAVDPEQYAATQRQVTDLNNRIKKMEGEQIALQTKLDEVRKSAHLPSGVSAVVTPRRGEAPAQSGATDGGFEEGLAQYRAGNLNGAIGTFEQYLNSGANGPEAAQAQYWLGEAYYMQRNYDMASRYLGAYLKAQPNGDRAQAALNRLVESLRAMGRNEDAETLAKQGVSALQ